MATNTKKTDIIGVLWSNSYYENKKKNVYLKGNIDLGVIGKRSVSLFKNKKTKETHPDWRMVISERVPVTSENGDLTFSYQQNSCGVFWEKQKNGKDKFLSGTLRIGMDNYQVSIFKNTRKEKDTHPDYNIVRFFETHVSFNDEGEYSYQKQDNPSDTDIDKASIDALEKMENNNAFENEMDVDVFPDGDEEEIPF